MIAAVISLNRQLEGARFAQFWAEVDQLRDLVNPVVGFYDAVRDFIVYLIEATFQKVSTATLAQSVRLEGASLNSLVRTWMFCHCAVLPTLIAVYYALLTSRLVGADPVEGQQPRLAGWAGRHHCICQQPY